MTKEELAEIRARAERFFGFYPLSPITIDKICGEDIPKLLAEVERLQHELLRLKRFRKYGEYGL